MESLLRPLLIYERNDSEIACKLKAAMMGATRLVVSPQDLLIERKSWNDALGPVTAAIARMQPDLLCLVASGDPTARAGQILKIAEQDPTFPKVIVCTGQIAPDQACDIIRSGALEVVVQPFRSEDLIPRLWRYHDAGKKGDLRDASEWKEREGLQELIGESPAFMAELRKIPAIARSGEAVLIAGETGIGKEVCARALHRLSARSNRPFVPVNCGALPTDLVENELFGHEAGAFTGANTATIGLIGEADGGTLFLDEIDSLPLLAQAKLLRFLQENEYRPLGARKLRHSDVRIIAASNANFADAIRGGRFRQDLYFRLNVIPLTLPPLRERPGDIGLLAQHFLDKHGRKSGMPAKRLSSGALHRLIAYQWPGNVRELENVVSRAVVFSSGTVIEARDIVLQTVISSPANASFQVLKRRVVEDFERSYIRQLLAESGGNITRAAKAARKHRRAFWQLIRKHGIEVSPAPPAVADRSLHP